MTLMRVTPWQWIRELLGLSFVVRSEPGWDPPPDEYGRTTLSDGTPIRLAGYPDDPLADERPRFEQIAARWQTDDSETAKDIRWLIWQLGAAWDFIRMDHALIEALGERIRKG